MTTEANETHNTNKGKIYPERTQTMVEDDNNDLKSPNQETFDHPSRTFGGKTTDANEVHNADKVKIYPKKTQSTTEANEVNHVQFSTEPDVVLNEGKNDKQQIFVKVTTEKRNEEQSQKSFDPSIRHGSIRNERIMATENNSKTKPVENFATLEQTRQHHKSFDLPNNTPAFGNGEIIEANVNQFHSSIHKSFDSYFCPSFEDALPTCNVDQKMIGDGNEIATAKRSKTIQLPIATIDETKKWNPCCTSDSNVCCPDKSKTLSEENQIPDKMAVIMLNNRSKYNGSKVPIESLLDTEDEASSFNPSVLEGNEKGEHFDDERFTERKPNDYFSECINGVWCFVCPTLEPLPMFTFLCLSIFAAIPPAFYMATFTKIGYGLVVFRYIDSNLEPLSFYIGIGVAIFAMALYLLDCYYWVSRCMRRSCLGLLAIGIIVFIISLSAQHPYGPVTIFLFLTTSWLAVVRLVFYHNVSAKTFVSWLSGPLLHVSLLVFIYWFVWTFLEDENEWNTINSLIDAEKSGCEPDFELYPQCEKQDSRSEDEDGSGEVCFEVDADSESIQFDYYCDEVCTKIYDNCLNSFIVWGGPLLVSFGLFFLSYVCTFLRGDGSEEQNISKLAKIWMFLLFGMWVSACLAGSGTGITATLMALTLAAFAASGVFLVAAYNSYEREEHLLQLWDKVVDKYGALLNPIRGLLVLTCTPVAFIYLFVAFIRQFIRNINFCCNKPPTDTFSLRHIAGAGWLTVEARRLVKIFSSWDRAKVLTWTIYSGILFMIMSVIVAEFTLVFLSWLIEKTSEMSILAVTAILVGVGMTMFLLPPVPGVPIYLTLGIVILPVGKDKFGIIGSIAYAMVVSLILKLAACTLQQKMIGSLLQRSVKVRQFVGINTNLVRSMKLVLLEPGMGIAKVTILIGCPDWPTSVLCGIMDLPLLPVLFGTLPIVFLILPTLLTGSFTYMSNLKTEDGQEEYPWAGTMVAVFATLTGIVQFGSMVVAAYFLEKAVSERGDELEKIPIDEEVKLADEKIEAANKAYDEVIKWDRLPGLAKNILLLSVACMILCFDLVMVASDQCFREYQLTYTIDQHLDGDWKNVVMPLGWVALSLFGISCLLFQIFVSWAKSKARNISETGQFA